jgi:ketosteroid isomerase-like protein
MRSLLTTHPDIVAFDAIAQLQFRGSDAYRKHWDACMSMCSGPMIFEVHDLAIDARDDLAFGWYLSRCGGTGPDGKERSGWMRATFCCRRTNGRWEIVHEHFSAPFDPETGKVLDLKP